MFTVVVLILYFFRLSVIRFRTEARNLKAVLTKFDPRRTTRAGLMLPQRLWLTLNLPATNRFSTFGVSACGTSSSTASLAGR